MGVENFGSTDLTWWWKVDKFEQPEHATTNSLFIMDSNHFWPCAKQFQLHKSQEEKTAYPNISRGQTTAEACMYVCASTNPHLPSTPQKRQLLYWAKKLRKSDQGRHPRPITSHCWWKSCMRWLAVPDELLSTPSNSFPILGDARRSLADWT